MKLQKTMQGQYFVIIPRDLIRIIKWKKEEEVEVILGSQTESKNDDIIIRRK
tara:strand:+ start:1472 stop:1627 length:156 start_codon:yes stop_codon:yes gene_type:complete